VGGYRNQCGDDRLFESVAIGPGQREQIDEGEREGVNTSERERLKTRESENKELRRANQIPNFGERFFCQGGA
jgi:transposase